MYFALFVTVLVVFIATVLWTVLERRHLMNLETIYFPQVTSAPVSKIPPCVHQTMKTRQVDHGFFRAVIQPNMDQNQDFQFEFYDNDRVAGLIQCHFPQHVYNAYCMINPKYGASLGDFARYCILYLYGGVYLDIKSGIRKPLRSLVEYAEKLPTSNVMLVSHWKDVSPHRLRYPPRGEIQNWVIISTPRHPVLYQIIEEMVDRIHRSGGGIGKEEVLALTGPLLMTDVILPNTEGVYITDLLHDYFMYKVYNDQCQGDCRQVLYDTSSTVPYDQITERVVLPHMRTLPEPESCMG